MFSNFCPVLSHSKKQLPLANKANANKHPTVAKPLFDQISVKLYALQRKDFGWAKNDEN